MTGAQVIAVDEAFLASGLSSEEVVRRRATGESNAVAFQSSRTYRRILFDNVVNPVHVILFVISGGLVALGLFGDAILTAGLVLGNVAVGVFQESRAKRQLDHIALLTRPQATVIRDGVEQVVEPDALVRGDLLVVRAGEQVQVDGPVLQEAGLSLDEALLTGESDLVRKHTGDPLHSGSYCMTGEGLQLAEVVGEGRLSHRITARARSFRNARTPLQQEVSVIIWAMAVLVALLGVAVAMSFAKIYQDLPLVESARAAAVVVALVPQGLWFMITVAYSIAIVRTARGGVLIQRMNAVESISRVDVLCFDKTGTLTTNHLKLETLQSLGPDDAELRRVLGDFAASASFKNRTSAAIEEAFGGTARAALAEVVFDSSRKWSALAFDEGVYVLGAPEVMAAGLTSNAHVDEIDVWTEKGLRVLLFAHRVGNDGVDLKSTEPELPGGMTPLAVVVLRDELRRDVSEIIDRFASGGVALKILSGDSPTTVSALARQAGIKADSAVSGSELDSLSDSELNSRIEEAVIFGRITPDDKERLINALRRRGHYVAMIGDGINDIPALKAAQVAVAMRSGSAAARNVADVVLLDDSFGALSRALVEGQRIRQGMQAIIRLFLVRTLAVAMVILAAALAAEEFPFSPRQTAVIATLTVGLPAVALAAWAKPGRGERLLLPSALGFVIPASILAGIAGAVVYLSYLGFDASLATARTALTATSVLCGIALIPYSVQPPRAWLTLEPLRQRLDLVGLSVVMFAIFWLDSSLPVLRDFFEIDLLNALDYVAVLTAVLGWAVMLKITWSLGAGELVERLAIRVFDRVPPDR